MDALLSECRCWNFRLKCAAHLKQLWEALAIPEETATLGMEVLKFFAAVIFLAVTGLILLMLE